MSNNYFNLNLNNLDSEPSNKEQSLMNTDPWTYDVSINNSFSSNNQSNSTSSNQSCNLSTNLSNTNLCTNSSANSHLNNLSSLNPVSVPPIHHNHNHNHNHHHHNHNHHLHHHHQTDLNNLTNNHLNSNSNHYYDFSTTTINSSSNSSIALSSSEYDSYNQQNLVINDRNHLMPSFYQTFTNSPDHTNSIQNNAKSNTNSFAFNSDCLPSVNQLITGHRSLSNVDQNHQHHHNHSHQTPQSNTPAPINQSSATQHHYSYATFGGHCSQTSLTLIPKTGIQESISKENQQHDQFQNYFSSSMNSDDHQLPPHDFHHVNPFKENIKLEQLEPLEDEFDERSLRRKTNNQRERMRVQKLNDSFDSLKYTLNDVKPTSSNHKFTKLGTLEAAYELINQLECEVKNKIHETHSNMSNN